MPIECGTGDGRFGRRTPCHVHPRQSGSVNGDAEPRDDRSRGARGARCGDEIMTCETLAPVVSGGLVS